MREQIQDWLDKLRQSTLQAADLQTALDQSPRQQLLYLRAGYIGVDSTVTGMALECDGQVHERPQDPADWPCGARKSWIATRRVCRRDCAGMGSGCGVPACARSSAGGTSALILAPPDCGGLQGVSIQVPHPAKSGTPAATRCPPATRPPVVCVGTVTYTIASPYILGIQK